MSDPIPKWVPTIRSSTVTRGTIYPDVPLILLHEETLASILEFSEREPTRETGGFLVGEFRIEGGEQVEIRHFLPASATQSRSGSLTFTHDTWADLHRAVEQRFPGERVVGWHHTHPDFGVFLSPYDLFVHRHFFSARWQVALVVDPQRRDFGFFQWKADAIVDCGFVCIHPRSEASAGRAPVEKS